MIRAGLLALLVLGYVLPGERVILQLTTLREKQAPLRVEATLVDGDPDWPSRVRFELHPEFGFRVSVENGGRWLVENGRVVAASDQKVPAWIPALGILVLKPEEALRAWLEWARIDIAVNQLARCGESDCFVVGGREAPRRRTRRRRCCGSPRCGCTPASRWRVRGSSACRARRGRPS